MTHLEAFRLLKSVHKQPIFEVRLIGTLPAAGYGMDLETAIEQAEAVQDESGCYIDALSDVENKSEIEEALEHFNLRSF